MDLECFARVLYRKKVSGEIVIRELCRFIDEERGKAIYQEIKNSEKIEDRFERYVSTYTPSNITAEISGLGCRGEGDFFIHRLIAAISCGDEKAELKLNVELDSRTQDDAGAVLIPRGRYDNKYDEDRDEKNRDNEKRDENKGYVVAAVDGMHSRLSSFPFLAGFHAARAALRDIMVKGARPIAFISDIHLANNGDVCKVFDYSAGIATVGELSNVPIVSGSTLRIGGDLVLGDRLTGCVGAIGYARRLLPRSATSVGDVLIMTEGSGGGTISTTAIFYGKKGIVKETLNLDFIKSANVILDMLEEKGFEKYAKMIHSMTDVTNGGIRGDAFELSEVSGCAIVLYEDKIMKAINKKVLKMLIELGIDPLGVSIDSLLLCVDKRIVDKISEAFEEKGVRYEIVGRVEDKYSSAGSVFVEKDGKRTVLQPKYREAPYTPIKKVASRKKPSKSEFEEIKSILKECAACSISKKEAVKAWIMGEFIKIRSSK